MADTNAKQPPLVDLEKLEGGPSESVLRNCTRTISVDFDLDEAIKKAAAEHLAELQAHPVTPDELGAFYKRLRNSGVIRGAAGPFEVRIEPTNAVFVTGGKGEVIKLEVANHGKRAWRDLTPDEARFVASLLLAAAGEVTHG